jgi:hypothetical protein
MRRAENTIEHIGSVAIVVAILGRVAPFQHLG